MDDSAFRRLFDLTDRVAIVTGGTRGIGLAIAEGYVLAGASVVVASRDADACERAAQHLTAMGGNAIGVATHLGDLDSVANLVETAAARFNGIDIVVNNAANPLAQELGAMTAEAFDKSMAVNLRGPVFLVQQALPYLERSTHAAVLNVASAGAFMFSPNISIYSAAKAALVSFTRSMAAAYADRGIRVNALAPGAVDTRMVRNNPPEFIAGMENAALMRRLAGADEMVGPALLLTSDAGSFITGQVLLADGGLVAH